MIAYSSPNFATLLFIPKNASVLFDYATSEYAMSWNFTAQDSLTKKSTTVSGNRRLKKVTCNNFRYKNVFGGEGAISPYSSSETQSFCTSSASIDFDAAKADVIKEMAKEIADRVLLNQASGYTVTLLYSPNSAW